MSTEPLLIPPAATEATREIVFEYYEDDSIYERCAAEIAAPVVAYELRRLAEATMNDDGSQAVVLARDLIARADEIERARGGDDQ